MTLLQHILKAGATLALAAIPAFPPTHAQDSPQPKQERKDDRKFFLHGSEVSREQYRAHVAGALEEKLKPEYWESEPSPVELASEVMDFLTSKRIILPALGPIQPELEIPPYDKAVMHEVLREYAQGQAAKGKPRHAHQVLRAMEHPAPETLIDQALDDLLKTPEKIDAWSGTDEIFNYWLNDKGAGDITKGTTADRLAIIAGRMARAGNLDYAYTLRAMLQQNFKADPAVLDDAFIGRARGMARESAALQALEVLKRIGHPKPEAIIDPVIDELFRDERITIQHAQELLTYWTGQKGAGDITKGTTADRVMAIARRYANAAWIDQTLPLYRILKEQFKADPSSLDGTLIQAAQDRARYGSPQSAYEILAAISHPDPAGFIDPLLEQFLDGTGQTGGAHIQYVLQYWRDQKGKGDISTGTTSARLLKLLRRGMASDMDEALKVYVALRDDFKGRGQATVHIPGLLLGTEFSFPLNLTPSHDRFIEYAKRRVDNTRPDEAYMVLLTLRHPEAEKLIDAELDKLLQEDYRLSIWLIQHVINYWRLKGGGSLEKGTTAEKVLRIAELVLKQNRPDMVGQYYKLVNEQFASLPAERRAAMIFRSHYLGALRPNRDVTEFHVMLNAYSSVENLLDQHGIPYPPVAEQQQIIREGFRRLAGLSYRKPDTEEDIKYAVSPLYDYFLLKPYLETREKPPKPEWLAEYGSRCLRRKSRQADGLAALAWAYRLAGKDDLLPKDTERYAHDALSNSKDASLDDILTLLAARGETPIEAVLLYAGMQRLKAGDLPNAGRAAAGLKDAATRRELVQDIHAAWSGLNEHHRRSQAVQILPMLARDGSDMLLYFAHLAGESGHRDLAAAAYRLAHHAAPEGGEKRAYLIGNDPERHDLTRKDYLRAWVNIGEGRAWDQDDDDAGRKNALYQDVLDEYGRRK
jgi:hypothetical protein